MKRVAGLDILKAISAFMVVCIHSAMASTFAEYFIAITRIAVPIFFIITGFFYPDIMYNNGSKRQLRKVLWLALWANILFFVWDIIWNGIHSATISDTITKLFTQTSARDLILFNESPFSGHLWYLNALLYVLVIMMFACKTNIVSKLYYFIPILLAADLVLGKYSIFFFGEALQYIYTRHFLFVGLPYFLIGMLLQDNMDTLSKVSSKFWLILSVIFLFMNLLERYELVIHDLNSIRDHYFSTTLLAVSLFCLFYMLQIPTDNTVLNTLANVGRNDSAYIYIIHPILISIIREQAQNRGVWDWFMFVIPLFVFILSILVVHLARKTIGFCSNLITPNCKHN